MAVRLSSTFVFRKLHQLTGILPLGVFLLEHFYTNSKAMTGPADFNNAVRDLQSIPYILFIEIGGIFIPLIYHAVYGLFITWEARPNNLAYPYPRNWFYTIQRITGLILFFLDRKSTRLNSSHSQISYAVFCLKKKKKKTQTIQQKRTKKQHLLQQHKTHTISSLHACHHPQPHPRPSTLTSYHLTLLLPYMCAP